MPNRTASIASIAAALLLAAATARASILVAPSIGGRNSALVGNDVATPLDGAAVLISNPAGIVERSGSDASVSVFTIFFDGHYSNRDIGYDTKSSEVPVAPTVFLSTDRLSPWHVGVGLYGSVGAAFNFPGDPAAGVPNRFFSEVTILQLGFVVGREIAPGLEVAIQPEPTYGKIRAHYGTPIGPASFDIDGLGITGSFGVLYHLSEATTLGVKYRGPGIVYMSGDANVGPEPDDVDLHLHLPQSVSFGFAHALAPRLLLAAGARWTDYAQFTKGQLDYRVHSPLDRGPFTDSRATFRYGLALEYALVPDHVWLRAGASREEWMMEPSS